MRGRCEFNRHERWKTSDHESLYGMYYKRSRCTCLNQINQVLPLLQPDGRLIYLNCEYKRYTVERWRKDRWSHNEMVKNEEEGGGKNKKRMKESCNDANSIAPRIYYTQSGITKMVDSCQRATR